MSRDGDNSAGVVERRLRMAAAAWFAQLRSDERSALDDLRFQEWLDADPKHVVAHDDLRETWDVLSGIAEEPEIQAMRRQALSRRVGFAGTLGFGRATPSLRAVPALAATLVLTIAAALALLFSATGQPYQAHHTVAGERNIITLDDGTLVTLASSSRLVTAFTPAERRVKLTKGEAYFDVAHNGERPFIVEAGSGEITALGTEFDVHKKNGETVVTLVQGRVEVAALGAQPADGPHKVQLAPGERVSYDKSGLSDVRRIDLARAVSWKDGRIFAENEPLEKVVAEINRHSKRKIQFGDGNHELRRIIVSGVFRTDRPETLVAFLKDAGVPVWGVKDSQGNIKLYLRPEARRG